MKKIVIAIGVLISIVSCSVYKGKLSQDEFVKWSIKSDTIFYNNKSVATYDHSEFELNPNHGRHAKPMHELSIYQFNLQVHTEELIKFIHTVHPKQKIEIVVPRR
jgi:hypothetical protein